MVIYWIVWGAIYPIVILGRETVLSMVRPQRLEAGAALLAAIPIVFAAAGRIFFGMGYEKATVWGLLGLLGTALGNGLFEEILWRGTYLALFPDSVLLSVIWPSLGFALWHYAPGSVSKGGGVVGLMVGAAFFGLFLSLLAKQTGTLWWSILAHTLAGIIMVI